MKVKLKTEQKDRQKLLLTMIVKDDSEVDILERCLSSFMPHFDGLAVAITGVKREDKKVKALIKKFGGRYVETNPETHPQIYTKEKDGYYFSNFAEARNVSFELASEMQKEGNYDWWGWADVDDIIIEAHELQNMAKIAKEQKLDAVFFTYWYAIVLRPDGSFDQNSVQIFHLRERLLKPNIWKWVSRLHEVAVPKDENYRPVQSVYDFNEAEKRMCVWVHLTDNTRTTNAVTRNIKILEEQKRVELAEGKDDPRTTFYLAKSYFDTGGQLNWQLADQMLNDYLESSGWDEERASAWEYKAQIRIQAGDHKAAIECLHNALKEFGNRHMQMLLLSQEYAAIGNLEQSDFWLNVATSMEDPKARTTIGNPLQLKFLAASLRYNQSARKPDSKEMLQWANIRNSLVEAPGDKEWIKALEEANRLNDACGWVFNYAKWLKDNNYKKNIKALLDSMPIDMGRELFAHQIANEVIEPRVWGDKEIAYFASGGGEHFEPWSPKNMDTGIGGSETAVIELAKRWVQMGYKVTVFGDPREEAGEYDGVTYKPYYAINWNDTFNILILWRSPYLLDKDIKAKQLFMDLHDVASQLDWTEPRMEKVTKVFFKSKFHRDMIPKLPDEKAVIISNGI